MTEIISENIQVILEAWKKNQEYLKAISSKDEELRNKIKIFLKERRWNKYNDKETGINISVVEYHQEVIDKQMLRILLDENKYKQVVKIKTVERMLINTAKDRERMSKYTRKGDTK